MCEAQPTVQQKKKETIDELSRLRAGKVNARKELERTNQEKRELSLKLTEMEDVLRSEELKHHFSNNRIYWKFIAEHVQWWGGFYDVSCDQSRHH